MVSSLCALLAACLLLSAGRACWLPGMSWLGRACAAAQPQPHYRDIISVVVWWYDDNYLIVFCVQAVPLSCRA
jgi:hypothetical protein